jgi:hypothetical protein
VFPVCSRGQFVLPHSSGALSYVLVLCSEGSLALKYAKESSWTFMTLLMALLILGHCNDCFHCVSNIQTRVYCTSTYLMHTLI